MIKQAQIYICSILFCFLALSTAQSEPDYGFPDPIKMSDGERKVFEEALPNDKCMKQKRMDLAKEYNAIFESEEISFDDKYGYIFRYDQLTKIPAQSKNEQVRIVHSRFAIFTRDCKSYALVIGNAPSKPIENPEHQ